jgi:tripartite-type tricarboxylate transporter receptor subunit TctC
MPTAVVKRLEQASLQMMSEPTLSDQFKKAGFMAAAGRADQLSDELKLGVDTWARVVKEAHIERE